MYHTVKKIKRLDFETLVWPGHAYKSMPGKTLEYLFDNNIYFIIDKEEDFIKFSDRREYSSLFKFI
ncbi:BaeB [Streptococcus mutans 15VF2]|nr:BaeB [Streptococcus mutans 15VF2]